MGTDTPSCNFNWVAPDFALPDPHGVLHTMRDYLGDKGLLVAFICNHCPYVQAIAKRLAADCRALQSEGISTLAVMSNDFDQYPADAPDKMLAFAREHDFGFPYLVDASQSVARAYGAVCTPDFFGLNAAGRLQYRGRLDDAGRDDERERVPELLQAMRQIAATGEGPSAPKPSIGCSIKWRSASPGASQST